MITISNLQKAFKEQVLFSDVNLSIGDKEKIGLIGRNGSGKSTFVKMILEQDDHESGEIDVPDSLKIRALEQYLNFDKETILKQVCSALPADAHGEEWKAKSILMGLGFTEKDFERPPREFSSGFQVRVRLAEALVSESHLLILDEPTNYLDILSLRWLERFLKNWNGSFILITHDQHFMEEVVTHVIGIHRGKMRKMRGGPQKLIQQIQLEEEVYEKTRQNMEKKQAKTKEFISKFRAGARSAGLVQSRIKSLDKQKIGVKLDKIPQIKFNFRYADFKGNDLIQAEDITFGYDKENPLINDFSMKTYASNRIAIIGRNGKGKSTLSQLLVGKLKPQGGTIKKGSNLKIAYFGADSKEALSPEKSIIEELIQLPNVTEQEVRNICGALLFTGNTVKKTISNLSGGEKSRVCLAKVMLSPANVLVLDEPTNHLDLESCQALTQALKVFPGTIIFVTHDEEMLAQVATRLVVFEEGSVTTREQTYQEFLESGGWSEEDENSFKITKKKSANKEEHLERKENKKRLRFIQNRQKALEKELVELDKKQAKNAEKFQKACEKKDSEKIKLLGIKAKEMSDLTDQMYTEFEELMKEEEKLNQLV